MLADEIMVSRDWLGVITNLKMMFRFKMMFKESKPQQCNVVNLVSRKIFWCHDSPGLLFRECNRTTWRHVTASWIGLFNLLR